MATAGTGAIAATAALSKPAIAQGVREIRLVTTWPRDFPGLGVGADRIAKRITAISEGRLNVTLYAAGELVPAFDSFDAVSSGNAEMYHGVEYYWEAKHKAFVFFGSVPLGMTAHE
ncbi:MAG TPA: ABC transporter substrate-binding protein, partial [Hyphomicrobiales bacterium]|nr:ABC transporter substrate-binding protein [Hyphomicrobiales bacterium]